MGLLLWEIQTRNRRPWAKCLKAFLAGTFTEYLLPHELENCGTLYFVAANPKIILFIFSFFTLIMKFIKLQTKGNSLSRN